MKFFYKVEISMEYLNESLKILDEMEENGEIDKYIKESLEENKIRRNSYIEFSKSKKFNEILSFMRKNNNTFSYEFIEINENVEFDGFLGSEIALFVNTITEVFEHSEDDIYSLFNSTIYYYKDIVVTLIFGQGCIAFINVAKENNEIKNLNLENEDLIECKENGWNWGIKNKLFFIEHKERNIYKESKYIMKLKEEMIG